LALVMPRLLVNTYVLRFRFAHDPASVVITGAINAY
jgi:hypothetical protein